MTALFLAAACDTIESMRYDPTPIAIILTSTAAPTEAPSPTATITPTRAPTATPTPLPTRPAYALPCDTTEGTMLDISDNPSALAQENLRYRVYVPPCYFETQQRYPLLILLHGLSYDESQWEDLGIEQTLNTAISSGRLAPMIVAMPYFGTIGQLNNFASDVNYERIIIEELLPDLQSNLCIMPSRQFRAIGGISRGGFWAYSIGLRHLDLFGRIGGHSAYFPGGIDEGYDPLVLAQDAQKLQRNQVALWLDNGGRDSAAASVREMSDILRDENVTVRHIVYPLGEHNNDYWGAHIDEYLAFYGEDWPTDYTDLPSCNADVS